MDAVTAVENYLNANRKHFTSRGGMSAVELLDNYLNESLIKGLNQGEIFIKDAQESFIKALDPGQVPYGRRVQDFSTEIIGRIGVRLAYSTAIDAIKEAKEDGLSPNSVIEAAIWELTRGLLKGGPISSSGCSGYFLEVQLDGYRNQAEKILMDLRSLSRKVSAAGRG